MVDEVTKKTLSNIPLLKTKASPRDGEQWRQRLKEELQALIQVKINNCFQQFELRMVFFFCFSTSKIIRMLTMIGFDWNRIPKVLVGGEKLGPLRICYAMSLTSSLM